MAIIYLGIGSNVGDRKINCMRAIEKLNGRNIRVMKMSSMHETKPWGFSEQPDFINMAVEGETSLSPRELLAAVKEIETEMGRENTRRWGPRTIDIDILLYDDIVVTMDNLRIPHPLMQERDFVLAPLAEIAPDTVHPVLRKTIRQLREELKGD